MIPLSRQSIWQQLIRRPGTRLGWWSVGLGVAFVVLFLPILFIPIIPELHWNRVILLFYSGAVFLCGLAAGVTGLIAVLRNRERSWLLGLTMLLGLSVILFFLNEFWVSH